MNSRSLGLLGALPLAASVLLPIAPAAAQQAAADAPVFAISGAIRVRAEAMDGQFRPATPADDSFVSIRTNLRAELSLNPFQLVGEVVDTRGYGERTHSSIDSKEVNALEPLQAYAALRFAHLLAKGDSLSLKGGRFTLSLGGNRLVARTDYSNVNPSFLGGEAEWKSKAGDGLVAFWTMPFQVLPSDSAGVHDNQVQFDDASPALRFFGAHGTKALPHGFSVEPYVYRLIERDTPTMLTRNRRLTTFGLRAFRAPAKGKFDTDTEVALQRGTERATTKASDKHDLTVDATMVHAELGYSFAAPWTPRVAALFDYASGDRGVPGHYGRFDALFGARRSDLNPGGLYGPLSRSNMVSPGVRIEAKPSKRLDVSFTARDVLLDSAADSFGATNVKDASGNAGHQAGWAFEAKARRWLVPKRLRVEVNVDWLAKDRFLTNAPNAPATGDTHYGYFEVAALF